MLWRIFKNLDFTQLFGLFGLFLKNPLYMIPTIFATRDCMNIAQQEYGDKHHFNNPANAFRHALWVIFIIQKCLRWRNNEEKAISWAEKFTNWHENFSPNEPLEEAMDLHNNQVGIYYYEEIKEKSIDEIIPFLKRKASEAKKIGAVDEVENLERRLVYIDD